MQKSIGLTQYAAIAQAKQYGVLAKVQALPSTEAAVYHVITWKYRAAKLALLSLACF
ncbi:MAG: hypothetical protein ACKO1L_02895 [Brachymonas sp.]